jgi:hypothetical protein
MNEGYVTQMVFDFRDAQFALLISTLDNDDNFHDRVVAAVKRAMHREIGDWGIVPDPTMLEGTEEEEELEHAED